MDKKASGFAIISVLAFAFMNLSVKMLPHIPFVELVWFRSLISIVLTVLMLRRKRISPWGSHKTLLWMRGIFGVTALSLFFYTLQKMPLATAVTLQYLSPIFTAAFAVIFLKEKMRPIQWVWFAVAFAGVLVIRGQDAGITWALFFAGLTSAIFTGGAYTVISKLKQRENPLVVVFYFPLVALPITSVFLLWFWESPSGIDWLFILIMGVATQIGQLYLTKAYQAADASKVAIFKYLGILFALFFDYSIFGIRHPIGVILGICLVVLGVLLQVLRKEARKI